MREIAVSWAAGFFDGEGTIYVHPGGEVVTLVVAQNVVLPLFLLQELFGGIVMPPKDYNHHRAYKWWLNRQPQVRTTLEAMLPYMMVKYEKAAEVLRNMRSLSDLEYASRHRRRPPT
jgi:hypothetical protein